MRECKRYGLIALVVSALLLCSCSGSPVRETDADEQVDALRREQTEDREEQAAADAEEVIAIPFAADGEEQASTGEGAPATSDPTEKEPPSHAEGTDSGAEVSAGIGTRQNSSDTSGQRSASPSATHIHNYAASTVPPTCTEGGYTLYTCTCGASYRGQEKTALGHSYTVTVVAPTTASQGYTLHKCSRCGASYQDSYTPQLAQEAPFDISSYVEWGKGYAESIGLILDPATMAGYDTPMVFTAEDAPYIKQWIMDDLKIHLKEGDTATWIWAEDTGDGIYEIFTGRG